MIRLTVEETNLLSIYNEGGKRALIENVNAAPKRNLQSFPFTPLMKYERG